MLFTLEALEAQHGDSLILHYGSPQRPRFIVIDGGPPGTYQNSLKPRLAMLKNQWSPKEPLAIEMVMVSHLDRDHIAGILEWSKELLEEREKTGETSYDLLSIWHNSFDDIVGKDQDGLVAALVESFALNVNRPKGPKVAAHTEIMMESVGEGRKLRDIAKSLDLLVNPGFTRLIMATETGKKIVDWGDGLKFTVISPSAKQLAKLQEDWDKKIETKKKKKVKPSDLNAEAVAYVDKSVYNLSSIVMIAELSEKRMLLTGDARGDVILQALEDADLLKKKGKMHVNLLKIPHHGSIHNFDSDFFERITADNYVISADGNYGNPDNETLKLLSEARGNDKFTIYLTNRQGKKGLGPRLANFFATEKKKKKKYAVEFRADNERSVRINLLSHISY